MYNSAHFPNAHHSQPTHNTSPIYPTYTNGASNPTMQGYHGQLSFGGHYRSPASALPLQVSQHRWSLYSENLIGLSVEWHWHSPKLEFSPFECPR